MKKILIALSLCLLLPAGLLAQGRINFNNSSATPIRINDGGLEWDMFDLSADPIIAPGSTTMILGTASTASFGYGPASAKIRLYGGATSDSLAPLPVGSGYTEYVLNTPNSTLAVAQGTFPGGSPLDVGSTSPIFLRFTATIETLGGGSPLYWGVSPIILVTPSLVPNTPTAVFAATADSSHWDGITMYFPDIPEPSSFALLSVGTAAVMISRRRKARL